MNKSLFGILDRRLLLLIIIGAMLFFYNFKNQVHCGQITGCIDKYWVYFWLISFEDGYERRALLGQIIRLIFGHSIDYLALNFVAFLMVTIILFIVYFVYFNYNFKKNIIPFILILSGPSTMVLYETLGDPLQISFLVFICYALIIINLSNALNTLKVIMALFTTIIVILIHEASIFLYLPVIYLLLCITSNKSPSFTHVTILTVFVGVTYSVLFNSQLPTGTSTGLILKDKSMLYVPIDVLPKFSTLIINEYYSYFGSLTAFKFFVTKIIRVMLWPIVAVLILSRFCQDKTLSKIFYPLLFLSLPLYAIGHDWGRFCVYTLLVSLFCSALIFSKKLDFNLEKFCFVKSFMNNKVYFISNQNMLYFFPLLYFANSYYRVDGLTNENMVYCIFSISIYIVMNLQKPSHQFKKTENVNCD